MIKIQEIDFPLDCEIVNNDFYTYDPENDFTPTDSLKYLNEDLFQCSFPEQDMVIDLGWYGDAALNKGEFRISIIIKENWEVPFNVLYSKSVVETKNIVSKIFQYYTRDTTYSEQAEI